MSSAVATIEATDVILRDGSTLRLRAPAAEDAEALVEFFSGLSDHTRYLRFHGFPALGPKLVEPVLEPDWQERGALVGSLDGSIVALANWVRLRDPHAAEIAFAVGDENQGRGIGTRLLEQLAGRAAEAGIEEFVAEVLQENTAMLGVFREAGFTISRAAEGGEVEIRLTIAPTGGYRQQVAARDHRAVRASLEPFFRPSSVAVVGASKRRGSIGGELFRNVLAGDFSGSVYPVNRNGDSVAGVHGYRSLAQIAEAIDLAVICVPGEQVLSAAENALGAGASALVVISAGFAETGSAGAERQE
jgi:ribosomal protein S18 acetylase RimI-like enzyme/predicted CoA-binding protein